VLLRAVCWAIVAVVSAAGVAVIRYNDMYNDMFEEAGVVRNWHLMPTAGRLSMGAVWAVASQKGCNCDVHLCHARLL
jgi:hypothetical protein